MWGIIPAAGAGTRLPGRSCSKELVEVGGRPVMDYIIERMAFAGVDKICVIVGPEKVDIVRHYGSVWKGAGGRRVGLCYVVQREPRGLADAIFMAIPFLSGGTVLIGLPDTIWFPVTGFNSTAPLVGLNLLVFESESPAEFDSVVFDESSRVSRVAVKSSAPPSSWVWGAISVSMRALWELRGVWKSTFNRDEPYIGAVMDRWIRQGGMASASKQGGPYLDIGTAAGLSVAQKYMEDQC